MAGIVPMELLIGTLQISLRAREFPFLFRHESDVCGGSTAHTAEFTQALQEAPRGTVCASGPGRASKRRPVAGVNGTDT